ncbi:MAG: SpoIIE family protein phosphatase [Planctomycetota bacterium]
MTGPLAGSEAEVAINRPLLIGRNAVCGLRLPGRGVSRTHARLDLEEQGLRLERLSAVNAVYVNGFPRTTQALALWDTIGIGSHVLRVESLHGARAGGSQRELRSDSSLLACLLEIQRLLSTDVDNMVERALDSLFLALPATRLSLFSVDADGAFEQGYTVARGGLPTTTMSRSFVRHVLEAGRAVLLNDDSTAAPLALEMTLRRQAVQAVIGVPVKHQDRTVAVLLCDNLERPGALDHTHLDVLAAVARALEHVFQRTDLRRLERDRMRAEVEFDVAQTVQRTLLDRDIATAAGPWRWAALYRPARELAGDYFDHGVDATGMSLVVADVSGKGVGAGMVVGMLRIAYKELWTRGLPPHELLIALDQRLRGEVPAHMFFTALVLHLAPHGRLRWAGIGHPEGLVLRGSAITHRLASTAGMCGILPEAMLRERLMTQELQLQPGDRIFLCTDGLAEAMDAEDRLFGQERGESALCQYATATPAEALAGVMAAVTAHVGTAEQSDDIALLAGDYTP